MTDREVRLGLVGYGHWGPNYLKSVQDVAGAAITWCADISEAALARARQAHPSLRTTTDVEELVSAKDCDAVIVTVPPSQHDAVARKALEVRKPVLVEKPLTDGVASAESLRRDAEAVGVIAMAGHVYLFNPAVDAIVQRVRSGALGRLRLLLAARMSTRMATSAERPDADVVWDLAPNDLAMFVAIAGSWPSRVHVAAGCHAGHDQADSAFVLLEFPGGTIADLRLAWDFHRRERLVTVVGARETIVFDDDAPQKLVLQPSDGRGDARPLPYDRTPALVRQLTAFVRCIRSGTVPENDFAYGARMVRLLGELDAARLTVC
jgi:predicted dehydrogenase